MTFSPGTILVFDRGYNDFLWFVPLALQGVWFVTRMKDGTRYRVVERRDVPRNGNILCDEVIELDVNLRPYGVGAARRVRKRRQPRHRDRLPRREGKGRLPRTHRPVAGVPAVIGSLRDVDDAEAAAVMVRLLEHIYRGVPATTALRAVQREMLHAPTRRHPAAWAAFTVLGADRR